MSKKDTIARTLLISTVLSLVSIDVSQALQGTYEEAMAIRRLLSAQAIDPQTKPGVKTQRSAVAESIVLPVSRGFNQGKTSLCWAYATLNALETIYLVRNPEGLEVELSRRAMQYYTMEDRYRRSIKGVNTYIKEGGIVLDAVRLIQSNGIVAFDDYYDIFDPYGKANILGMIDSEENFTGKITAMYTGMDIVYTAPPTLTHIPSSLAVDDPNLTYVEAEAGDLARLVLSRDAWQSYSPSETKVGFHDHPDPDARWENVSWYMPRSEFPGRIKQALQAGFPVIVSIQNHGVLLHGADYDSNGSPITYYIKDSYNTLRIIGGTIAWDYYYLSGADLLHVNLWEMTTVKL